MNSRSVWKAVTSKPDVLHGGGLEVSGLGLSAHSHGSPRHVVGFIRNLVSRVVLCLRSWLAPLSLPSSFFSTAWQFEGFLDAWRGGGLRGLPAMKEIFSPEAGWSASSRSPSTSQALNLHFAMGLLIMQGLSHNLLSFSVATWPSRHVIENHL